MPRDGQRQKQQEGDHLPAEERGLRRTYLGFEKMNFYCLSPSVYGVLLWQL